MLEFQPSATRCSTLQIPEPIPMRPMLMPTEGPLAQDPHAIVEIMRLWLVEKYRSNWINYRSIWSNDYISNEDPLSVPINFREEYFEEGRLYRIGITILSFPLIFDLLRLLYFWWLHRSSAWQSASCWRSSRIVKGKGWDDVTVGETPTCLLPYLSD